MRCCWRRWVLARSASSLMSSSLALSRVYAPSTASAVAAVQDVRAAVQDVRAALRDVREEAENAAKAAAEETIEESLWLIAGVFM
jgi:hypothetical protein